MGDRQFTIRMALVIVLALAAAPCCPGCSGASSSDGGSNPVAEASASDASASSSTSDVQSAESAASNKASASSDSVKDVVEDIAVEAIAQFVLSYNDISDSPIDYVWKTGRSSYAGESYGYVLNISDTTSQTCVRIGNHADFAGMVKPFVDVVRAYDPKLKGDAERLFGDAMASFATSKEDVSGNVGNLKVTFSIMNEVERGHIQVYRFK